MRSVLRPVRKRKKGRTLGPVEIIRREDYADLELDAKVELIRSLVPLGLMHVEELLDAEVTALAGERYARKAAAIGGRRHGSNPGTVGLAGQRVPIRVPRIRHVAGNEMRLRSHEALQGDRAVNDRLLKRVLYGISCRNYEAAAEAIPGAIGLSGSTVSRGFIQASAAQLREFQERDLSGEDVVAVVLDGKTFADATMVIALGITLSGEKRFLGFVETDTENAQVLTPFLRSLVERGLDVSQGVLVILDGGKGLRSAVRKAFRDRALVHRCQWHKRENVVRYQDTAHLGSFLSWDDVRFSTSSNHRVWEPFHFPTKFRSPSSTVAQRRTRSRWCAHASCADGGETFRSAARPLRTFCRYTRQPVLPSGSCSWAEHESGGGFAAADPAWRPR